MIPYIFILFVSIFIIYIYFLFVSIIINYIYILFVSNPQCCEYNPQLGFVVSEAETSRALLSRPLAI